MLINEMISEIDRGLQKQKSCAPTIKAQLFARCSTQGNHPLAHLNPLKKGSFMGQALSGDNTAQLVFIS